MSLITFTFKSSTKYAITKMIRYAHNLGGGICHTYNQQEIGVQDT